MQTLQFTTCIDGGAAIVSSLCAILTFLANVSAPSPTRDITKKFIAMSAFLAGAFLAAFLFSLISLVSPNHPFACVMSLTACKSANPLYIGGALLLLGAFMLVGGGFSLWGTWTLVKKYLP